MKKNDVRVATITFPTRPMRLWSRINIGFTCLPTGKMTGFSFFMNASKFLKGTESDSIKGVIENIKKKGGRVIYDYKISSNSLSDFLSFRYRR